MDSMCKIKGLLLLMLLAVTSSMLSAQDFEIRRGGCLPEGEGDTPAAGHRAPRRLPALNRNWDPNRTYHQLVILVSYALDNVDFSTSDPKATYEQLFNEPGYTEDGRKGKGCVADYFREQSGGLFNLQFDIYGPYRVNYKAQPIDNPNANTKNRQINAMRAATQLFLEENPGLDFSQYDWDADGKINQVVFVHAGYAGNMNSPNVFGYLWPSTMSFSLLTTPDGNYSISDYTASAELLPNNRLCGIGTICHEYSHSLGLPDIYPTSGWTLSAVDEWDLMDGGNFTNYGWCPPNFSPLEKMLLGWKEPIELKEPCSVTDLKPISDGGDIYQVKHTDTEYLLLENRQPTGWDLGNPGKGLVIYHVNYIESKWTSNSVNSTRNVLNYSLVYADNRDYDTWDDLIAEKGINRYANSGWMNNLHLSGSPYPYATDSTETVDALTDTSVPAAVMLNENSEGSKLLSKPITNIRMSENGLISFDFMGGGTSTEVIRELNSIDSAPTVCFDLSGRPASAGSKGLLFTRRTDGRIVKRIRK